MLVGEPRYLYNREESFRLYRQRYLVGNVWCLCQVLGDLLLDVCDKIELCARISRTDFLCLICSVLCSGQHRFFRIYELKIHPVPLPVFG